MVVIAIILAAPKFMPYRQPQPADKTVSLGESHPKQRVGGQEMVGMFFTYKIALLFSDYEDLFSIL